MRRERFRFGATLALAAALVLSTGAADARSKQPSGPPPVVPPLDATNAGVPLDPSWRKHVYVITDSVMLGAKDKFIKALPDWEVTFDGRPAIQIRQALKEYTLGRRDTGPVAVVALGYNTLWEKDRKNFKRWADMFDKHVEEMNAALKERGAKKIVWVYLRELTRDMITTGGVSLSQYNRYAWYFPYVNERLKAIKERHPEMAIADWAAAAHVPGVTYDAIHLNGPGANLMVEVVKTAMGVYGEPTQTRIAAAKPAPAPLPAPIGRAIVETPRTEPAPPRVAATTPRVIATVQTRAEAAQARIEQAPLAPVQARVEQRIEQPRIEQVRLAAPPPPLVEVAQARVEDTPISAPRKKPSYRGSRLEMFALSAFRTAPVVMLGDSLTERAQWAEITGCGYVANRGIGGDDSAGVLRRLDAVIRMRPGAVFLNIGVNDLVSNVPTETTVGNVRETIERLTQGGAKVYLTLVLPVTQKFARRIDRRMDELNEAYVKLAAQTGATVVDFRSAMQDRSGLLRDEMSLDGIHLTPAGYRPWRDAVAPLVARHCGSPDELVAQAAPAAPAAPVANVTTAVKRTSAPAALETAPAAPQAAPQPAPQAAVADLTASIPSRPTTARGGWIIQVGAFPEHEKAQERIREAQTMARDLLANADPFTEKVTKGSLELYRARFAGFNQSSAEAACSYFKRKSVDCIFLKR